MSIKIKKIQINKHKKAILIKTDGGLFEYPFSKLSVTTRNSLANVYIDSDLGGEGFGYVLTSGKEGTVPMDQVLEYNKDPDYLRDMILYKLTLKVQELLAKSKVSKRAIIRKMGTSPTQFYRLTDQTNYNKSIDEMLRLVAALDYTVELDFKKAA